MSTCPCGLDLDIWQNPWNHKAGCDLQPSREGEKDRLLRDASFLLERGTSNSLIAADRQRWNLERDRVVEEIRVELLQ